MGFFKRGAEPPPTKFHTILVTVVDTGLVVHSKNCDPIQHTIEGVATFCPLWSSRNDGLYQPPAKLLVNGLCLTRHQLAPAC
jgi:hypothetical protein